MTSTVPSYIFNKDNCMKKILILIFLLGASHHLIGQSSNDILETTKSEDKIFETAPEPKNGMTGFMKFISSNIKYPRDARKQGKQGEVLVEFVVSSDGTVKSESVRIVKSVFESIDKEVLRVMRLSPKWTPGTRNGQPIDMRMVIPIFFRL